MTTRIAWIAIGFELAAGLWTSWHPVGAVVLVGAIVAFAAMVWRRKGAYAWLGLGVCGLAMTAVLGWAALTSARCPAAGEGLEIRPNKPLVMCAELRSSETAMAIMFGLFAAASFAWPTLRRRGIIAFADADEDLVTSV
jgi:hypothetical protein